MAVAPTVTIYWAHETRLGWGITWGITRGITWGFPLGDTTTCKSVQCAYEYRMYINTTTDYADKSHVYNCVSQFKRPPMTSTARLHASMDNP